MKKLFPLCNIPQSDFVFFILSDRNVGIVRMIDKLRPIASYNILAIRFSQKCKMGNVLKVLLILYLLQLFLSKD